MIDVLRKAKGGGGGGVTLQQLNYSQHSLLRSVLRCLSHVDIHLVEAVEVRDLLDLPGGYDETTPVKAIQFGPVDTKSHMGVLMALMRELHERAEDVKTHVTCIQVKHGKLMKYIPPAVAACGDLTAVPCSSGPKMTHSPTQPMNAPLYKCTSCVPSFRTKPQGGTTPRALGGSSSQPP